MANRSDLLSSVLESQRPSVAVLDGEYRSSRWNASAEDLWGVREDEAMGRALADPDGGLPVDRLIPCCASTPGPSGLLVVMDRQD